MTIPRAVVWIFAWCASALVLAQQAADTSRIAGTVIDAAEQGVPRAIVMLTGSPLPTGRAAVTDDRGHFAFERLPAGRYSLTSAKPAYLKATYGALRPGGTGTTITLVAGQTLDDVRLAMPHGGAIAGTIRNLKGEPIPGLQVSVVRANAPVSPIPVRPDSVNTDGRGAYRLFGLAPGTYVVAATQTSSGGLGEVGVMSTAEVDAAMARLRSRTSATGAPATPAASPSSIVRPVHTFTTSPIFFPGVTSVGDAQTITLGLSEERVGVDFVYQLVRAAAVAGTVSGGGAQAVQLTLAPEGGTLVLAPVFGAGPMLQRRSGGDGTFVFTNVTPGKYSLIARTVSPAPARGAPAPVAANPQSTLFAMTSVEVSGDEVSGLLLNLAPALHVSGRVTVHGAGAAPLPDLTKIRIRMSSPSANGTMAMAMAGVAVAPLQFAATVGADGTFDIGGVVPDSYRIETQGDASVWRPVSALLNGRDLFDVPLEVTSTDVGEIEIVLSDRHSQISGRLLQANGGVATGYFVVAFPIDESLRRASRRLKSVRPSTDGQFHFDDLPAGDYYLAALTDADSDEWQAPAFLTRAAANAVKISIANDSRLTQDLRIGGR